jgi:polyisoprenyl-teichoic acid--peptidoglycan teichoic acid transferase
MKNKKKLIITFLSIIAICLITLISFSYYQLSKIKITKISKTNTDLGINKTVLDAINKKTNDDSIKSNEINTKVEKKEIINIILYGDDRLNKDENGRSDSIIILSLDQNNNRIKLCSILRDSYVNVEGYGMTKINHAFSYGGPQLSIKTINQNYGMDIKDFIKVDFDGLKEIVDYFGGVEITVKDYEVPGLIKVGIGKSGIYNLNGEQALAYSRIRYYGNSDFERTDRQRLVLSKLYEKIKNKGAINFPEVVFKLLPYVETSLNKNDIISLGISILSSDIGDIEQLRLPLDNYYKDSMINGIYYLQWDEKPNLDALHKFIWGDNSTYMPK